MGKLVPSGSSQSRGVPGTCGEGGVSVDACFGVAPGEWGALTESKDEQSVDANGRTFEAQRLL